VSGESSSVKKTLKIEHVHLGAALLLGSLFAVTLLRQKYLPIQDWPQHLAAVRVLHDYDSPGLRFDQYFELTPFATQYLSVYYSSHWLAYLVGVPLALKLVLSAALVALPVSLWDLLRELRRPTEYALLAFPFVYNAHAQLGFINFVAALPLLYFGIARTLAFRERGRRRDAVALGAIAALCFLTHVVPYVLLVGSVIVSMATRSYRDWLLRCAPLAPSLLLAMAWSVKSPSGKVLFSGPGLLFAPRPSFEQAWSELPMWLNQVSRSGVEGWLLCAWCFLLLGVAVVGVLYPAPGGASVRRLMWLPAACALLYFVLPQGYGFIWPINARFALLALLSVVPLLPNLHRNARFALTVLSCLLAVASWGNVDTALRFASAEYDGLSGCIQRIPQGSRVVGLIYARGSRYLEFSPYLHAAALVQAERGGVAMFSFADFPASVYRFREATRPPRVPPRWEWMPQRVDPESDLAYYDYALTRGAPRALPGFQRLERSGLWAVWSRSSPAP